MSYQNDIAQILVLKDVHHILNMDFKTNLTGKQMRAFATARERRRVRFMTGGAQERDDTLPHPASLNATVNENENCH
jgi:hypothetical protein